MNSIGGGNGRDHGGGGENSNLNRNPKFQFQEDQPSPQEALQKLFMTFVSVSSHQEMIELVNPLSEDMLNMLERTADAILVQAQGEEAEILRERLAALRRIRSQGRVTPVQQAVLDFVRASTDDEARALLLAQPALLLTTEARDLLDIAVTSVDDDEVRTHIKERKALWERVRLEGSGQPASSPAPQSAPQSAPQEPDAAQLAQQLANLVTGWIQTPDWAASEAYLRQHEAVLLTDVGEMVLNMLLQNNPGNEAIQQHIKLLNACRQQGITAVYAQLRGQSAPDSQAQAAELAQKLAKMLSEWIETPDWAASEAYLRQHEAVLLTDVGEMVLKLLLQNNPDNKTLEQHVQLLNACRQQGITAVYAQLRGQNAPDPQAQAAEMAQKLAKMLSEWIETPNWDASEAYLRQHEAVLLSEVGVMGLELLLKQFPNEQILQQHLALLQACRQHGITGVYAQLRAQIAANRGGQ